MDKTENLKLTFHPFDLQLKHKFTISLNSRTFTPLMLVEFEHGGYVGYGEASMPPYLSETQTSATEFLSKINLNNFSDPLSQQEDILNYVKGIAPGNPAAKAAIDIALHDLIGKIKNIPCWKMLGSDPQKMPLNSCTLGIDTPEVMRKKVLDADAFKVLKIKLGSEDDKLIINTIREITDKPLYVDANQGWKDVVFAEDMMHWLKEKGVVLVEQPMPKSDLESHARLKEKKILPTFADESFQNISDLPKIKEAFDGVNIKLMKCGGINAAAQIIRDARKEQMKILIGCMNESSCAIMAAAALAPQCDFVDLDGPFLVKNNPFADPIMKDGKIQLSNEPGLGIKKNLD